VAEVKASKSNVGFDSKSDLEKWRQIINKEPSATTATTKIQLDELDEPEEGECLFHSEMCMKGTLLHFIIDSGSKNNLNSSKFIKRLALPTTPHPHSYTIKWIFQESDLRVSQKCCLPYDIKPFKDEVLCDLTPIEVCDVLLGQTYLWKRHVIYDSRSCSVLITLEKKLHKIP
jgi:hypothetical protein